MHIEIDKGEELTIKHNGQPVGRIQGGELILYVQEGHYIFNLETATGTLDAPEIRRP